MATKPKPIDTGIYATLDYQNAESRAIQKSTLAAGRTFCIFLNRETNRFYVVAKSAATDPILTECILISTIRYTTETGIRHGVAAGFDYS